MVSEKSIRPARDELQDVIRQLRGLQSTISVAVGALRHQNADIDADIAHLLQRSVGDRLEEQVQKLEAMLSRAPRPAARKR
jgi:SMC interacting uncharacterized protein involved in chromosome segregation